jgi:hypothetical protein
VPGAAKHNVMRPPSRGPASFWCSQRASNGSLSLIALKVKTQEVKTQEVKTQVPRQARRRQNPSRLTLWPPLIGGWKQRITEQLQQIQVAAHIL